LAVTEVLFVMEQSAASTESELAMERIENLQFRLRRKRKSSAILACLALVVGSVVLVFRLPMIAFCFAVIAIFFMLRYFDANSHLHEVGRRTTKTLFTRLPQAQAVERKATMRPEVHR
jgi:hypothetical protein